MRESTLSVLAVTVLCAGSFSFAAAPAWPDIKVEVKADQPVATAQSLKQQADGFHRLAITLSNPGQQPLTIEKITVRIPVAERLTDDLEMLYGGSCMGRTPLLRQNVGTQTKLSSSHMYEMVRLADGQYLFAGSLSWRIFLPNLTLKNGAFVVWSNGEGKQLKPGETIQYEQIVLRRAGNWLDLLNQFGTAIAAENGITKLKDADFKGWATWDYYGRVFTANDIHPVYPAFPERSLANLGHFYLSGKVFHGDADYLVFRAAADEDEKVCKEKFKHGGSMTMNEAQMWADFNKLYGNFRLSSDNLITLRPERQALVKEVFQYPAMDETVPLDIWRHATNKGDGFELVLARKGKETYLGVFNWGDTPKEYTLAPFGKPEPVELAGRHSVILKYDGKHSFARLCQELQSR